MAWLGTVGCGTSRLARLVEFWRGKLRSGMAGTARRDMARPGWAWHGWHGMSSYGIARNVFLGIGSAGEVRLVKARYVGAWFGMAGMARLGKAGQGRYWRGRAGRVSSGLARRGAAWFGRRGK